jgi:hypothetical protein
MKLLWVLRGVIGTAAVWAAGWTTLSLVPLGLLAVFGATLPSSDWLPILLINRLISGATNGVAFASIVAVAGRRKTFAQVGLPWIATCGALGAMLLPLVGQLAWGAAIPWGYLPYALGIDAIFGATLAAGSLSLARRIPDERRLDARNSAALDAGVA